MKIHVLVKPNAKENSVEQANGIFRISLKAHPIDNEANIELIKVVAGYFKVPKSSISIEKGHNSRNKVLDVSLNENSKR